MGTNWNAKYLRALQRMLIPTQGKGVSTRSFFEADFGKTAEEFVEALAMPEVHLGWRGHFVERPNEPKDVTRARKNVWNENNCYLSEWKRLFRGLTPVERDEFVSYINDNNFSVERFETIENKTYRKLFIHYFTQPTLLRAFVSENSDTISDIKDYIIIEFPLMYKRMVEYIIIVKTQFAILEGPLRVFGAQLIKNIFTSTDIFSETHSSIFSNLQKVQLKAKLQVFDMNLINYTVLFIQAGVFTKKDTNAIRCFFKELNEIESKKMLCKKLPLLEKKLKKVASEQVGSDYILKEIKESLLQLNKQLSLFGDAE
ncbi:MAG: hypothetical protein ACI4I9_03645 [Porcipelethomonas sp.]